MKIHQNITELIGQTPIVELQSFSQESNSAKLFGKVEFFNPGGSVKDRLAYALIQDALLQNQMTVHTTIIEASSGNTGIGLAAVGAAMGIKVIIVMPETMSIERRKIVQAYGAQLVLSDGTKGMTGAIAKAKELLEATEDSIMLGQFTNKVNSKMHYQTTGPEIWNDMDGNVDVFIAGVGTGGTITGVAQYLKERNSKIKVIAVEPQASPVLSGGAPGPHKLQGIGAGFVPELFDASLIDEVQVITTEEAYDAARKLARQEGILTGISSGAALAAAFKIAERVENQHKNIVVLLPDTGERYLSTEVY
ncbi:MAG: cysteine synthase A [Lachnospiraceae bacterium]|nr:cysteine synthase A [Lachnospiraceae bacterium]